MRFSLSVLLVALQDLVSTHPAIHNFLEEVELLLVTVCPNDQAVEE
jgi:hypothetical protein